jgi:Fe-Mn family superoxide dismutase
MTYGFLNYLVEGKEGKLSIKELPYDEGALAPCVSKDTIDYHYEHLAKTYAKRYNKGEGDPVFNEAGVYLHNILFQQYQAPSDSNEPSGKVAELIKEHFKSFAKFKDAFLKEAMALQGSGWVYLARNGEIKTIHNHAIKKDIVVLIDWWEHAWALDYKSDKKAYLENQWKIINWDHINDTYSR